jgi:hypothetical protein
MLNKVCWVIRERNYQNFTEHPGYEANFVFHRTTSITCECVTRQLKIQQSANKTVCTELFVQNETGYADQTAFRNNVSQDPSFANIDTCSVQRVFCTRHVQGIRRYVWWNIERVPFSTIHVSRHELWTPYTISLRQTTPGTSLCQIVDFWSESLMEAR